MDRATYNIIRFLFAGIALVLSFSANSANNDYEDLKQKASNELIDMAERNMRSDTLWQNSIVALNIVASRYSEKSDKTTRRDAVVAMRHLGNLYITYDVDYNKAYRYLHTARQIAEEDNDIYDLAFIYNNLANIYHWGTVSTADKSSWTEYLTKAADAAAESKNQEAMMPIALNIISVSSEDSLLWKRYKNQIDKITKFTFSSKYSSEGNLARTLIQGWKKFMEGDTEGAVSKFQEAREITLGSDLDSRYTYSIDILLTDILHASGDYDNCLSLLKAMSANAKNSDNKDYELSAYKRIASIYAETGKPDSAAEYSKKYKNLKSIFEKRAGFRDVGVLNFLSEIEKIEAMDGMSSGSKGDNVGREWIWWALPLSVIIVILMATFLARRKSRNLQQHPDEESQVIIHEEYGNLEADVDVSNDEETDENDDEDDTIPNNSTGQCNEESEEELSAIYARIMDGDDFY